MTPGGCDLCLELRGDPSATDLRASYDGDPAERSLARSANLRLIADLSPLVEGHCLLLPLEHHLNFAEVMARHAEEVVALLDRVLPMYRDAYGNLTVLEHGSSSAMLGSACVHHAHLHLLPLDGTAMDQVMTRDGLRAEHVEGLAGLAAYAGVDRPYFLRMDTRGVRLYGLGAQMPGQYLRKAAGEVLGLAPGAYDWAAVTRRDAMRATVERMGNLLSERWNSGRARR